MIQETQEPTDLVRTPERYLVNTGINYIASPPATAGGTDKTEEQPPAHAGGTDKSDPPAAVEGAGGTDKTEEGPPAYAGGSDRTEKRVEAGDIVADIPEASIAWLVADGHISLVEGEK